jgi:hypothetical protein
MPTTGRSYYPNVPGPLEQALATQLGTNPWAPVFYSNAQNERRRAMDAVNETQAQQYVLGLQSELAKAKIDTLGSVIGSGVSSGHALGPLLGALNSNFDAGIPQDQISQEQTLSRGAELAGVAKTTGEASDAAVKAGTPYDLSTLNGIAPGLLHMGQGTPEDITKEGMGNKTALEVAKINAAAKDRATAAKGKSKGTGEPVVTDHYILDGFDRTVKGSESQMDGRLSPENQAKIDKARGAGSVQDEHNKLDVHDASGDAPTQDPELAHQQAALAQGGYTLLNGHGDPRPWTQNGKIGKKFVVTDKNGVTSEQFVPNARQ